MPRSGRRPRDHPFLAGPGPLAVAHRGGDIGGGRENTMAAFQAAVDQGFRHLETDLHATRDGVLVAFHDETLDRATDHRGPIAATTAAELARVRVAGRDPIPRFDELLTSFPHVSWNLDLKDDRVVAPFVRYVVRDPGLLARCCVGSFDDARLSGVRRAVGPALLTAAGPREVRLVRLLSLAGPLTPAVPLRADCLQVPVRWGRWPVIDGPFLRTARRLGLPVHVWTINETEQMSRLLDLGVDGLVTDRTATLRRVLLERREWEQGGAQELR
jgi:glycerophosphoryl diester phosphodiesterase